MERIILLLMVSLLTFGYAKRNASIADKEKEKELIIKSKDNKEQEYELIIIDPAFKTWFVSNSKPISFHSASYYEAQNRKYVTSWNELFQLTGGAGPFGNYIDYRFSEDYGLELNYELYWYFKYIEARYGKRYNFPY